MATTEFGDPVVDNTPQTTEFGDVAISAAPIATAFQASKNQADYPQMGQFPKVDNFSQLQQSAIDALPFRGASAAFKLGQKSGNDVLGNNLAGDILGSIFGTATSLGTAFNPLGVGANYYTKLAQATGESLAGQQDLATQTLTGQRNVVPTFSGTGGTSTTQNFITDLLAQAANDPVNAAMLLEAAKSPQTIGALKTLPKSALDLATLKAPREAIANRGIFRQPLKEATTEAIGITPAEGAQDVVPVLKSSIIESNNGKIPTGNPQEVIKKAADFKINQYKDGLKLAEEQGLRHPTQSLIDAMETKLIEDHPTFSPAQIKSTIDSVKQENPKLFEADYISPTEGQKAAVSINRDVNSKNPNRVVKSNAQLNAETALSQELSRQGKELYQAATGTYGTPNQDWGILKEVQGSNLQELINAGNADAGKTIGGKAPALTLTDLILKTGRKIGGRALIPTKQENVAGSFQRVLRKGENRPDAGTIDPAFQQDIIARYTPGVKPPPIPVTATIAPPTPSVAPITPTPVAPQVLAIPLPPAQAEFSLNTQVGLRKLGLKPSDPLWETMGNQIEFGTGFPDVPPGSTTIPYKNQPQNLEQFNPILSSFEMPPKGMTSYELHDWIAMKNDIVALKKLPFQELKNLQNSLDSVIANKGLDYNQKNALNNLRNKVADAQIAPTIDIPSSPGF